MKPNAFLQGNEEIPGGYLVLLVITQVYNLCALCILHQSSHICLAPF